MDDGADCNTENEDWFYSFQSIGAEAECDNAVKSCRRHLCECDKQFALGIGINSTNIEILQLLLIMNKKIQEFYFSDFSVNNFLLE